MMMYAHDFAEFGVVMMLFLIGLELEPKKLWELRVRLLAGMWRVYMPGPYHFEAFALRTRVVATNKGRFVPYRGPWANETFVRERMLDVVAAELGMSPAVIRTKNMIGGDDAPPAFLTGPTIDETMSTRKTQGSGSES